MDENKFKGEPELTHSSSSDEWESDEEAEGKDIGYQPLPQEPIENGESSDKNLSDDDTNADEVKPKDTVSPRELNVSPSMDSGHANVVLNAMAGFNLSPTNIPEWAKVVPEEVWKNELMAKLKSSKSSSR